MTPRDPNHHHRIGGGGGGSSSGDGGGGVGSSETQHLSCRSRYLRPASSAAPLSFAAAPLCPPNRLPLFASPPLLSPRPIGLPF
jgi:hypothetical protein